MKQENDAQHGSVVETARKLEQHRTGIVLTGHIKNGKVELDQTTLDEIARKFAGSNKSFIAVNAPFDPKSL
jgi:hypothetical protein